MDRMDDSTAVPIIRRRRWVAPKWIALLATLAVVSMIGLAPSLVAVMPPLLQSIVDSSAPQLHGHAKVGGASLGWFAPVVLHDVVWRDADGNVLAKVSAVRLERTVWQLLKNSADVGVIHVEQPQVIVVLREDGSNLEDAIAHLMEHQTTSAPSAMTLEVTDGTLELVDSTQQLAWQVEQINASVKLPAGAEELSQVAVQGHIHDTQGTPRPINATYAWLASGATPSPGAPGGTLTLKSTETPLAMLRPLLRRFVPGGEIDGVVTCDVAFAHNADNSQQQLKIAQFAGKDLLLAAPQWIGQDALRSEQLTATGALDFANGRMKLTGVQLNTDFARLAADGQLPLGGWDQSASATALAALRSEDYVLRGEVDVARLAKLLPGTLRIRPGTEITSGVVTLQLTSQTQGKKHRWDGELKSSQLTAVRDGREIRWDEPITVTLAAQQSAAGPVIERLTCASSFLAMQARGTLDQGELTVNGDLQQLHSELSRFSDVDDVQLAGKLQGSLAWQCGRDGDFEAQGQADVTDFELVVPNQQPWRERQVTCDLVASGRATVSGLGQLDHARVRMIAGDDRLEAELTQAVNNPLFNRTWPITGTLRGELAQWLPRVQAWLPVVVEQASGSAKIDLQVVIAPEALQLQQIKLDVANLQARTMGLTIAEPEVHVSGDGLWTYAAGRFDSQTMTVATSALSFRGNKLAIEPRARGMAISGEVGYRADLERLADWLNPPGSAPTRKWYGTTEGRAVFTHQGNTTQAKWTAEFLDLALAHRRVGAAPITPVSAPSSEWEPVWQEPKLEWHGQGEFDHVRNQLTATHLNVTSDMVSVTARGQIDALTTAPVVDLTGEIAYDLKNVAAIVGSYLGDGVKMAGTDKRQFMIRGPLPTYATFASQDRRTPPVQKLTWPKELVGRAGIGWTSAELYGLPVGAANVDGVLENGVVTIAPLDVQVAEGRIKAWPRLVVGNDPMVFQFAKGTRVEQVQITPQMCQTWLKYVAPLLADATRAEGKFSLNVEGATFPLVTPQFGEARGTLTVHGAQVGPGPLAETYISLAQQIRLLLERKPLDPNFRASAVEFLTLPQQDVEVEMKGGRVYHRGLQLQVGDTTLVTTGSVGVDQTLALNIQVPIREEWIAKDRLLSGLRGQSLTIPVGGTVNRPQLDGRVLDQLARQLFQNSAGQLLENTLQDGLNKLLRPK